MHRRSFTSNNKNSNNHHTQNSHIHFSETTTSSSSSTSSNSDDDDEENMASPEIITLDESPPTTTATSRTQPQQQLQRLNITLLKNRAQNEISFGFDLLGENGSLRRGEHRIEGVDAGSAAHRANLKPGDRLVSVNGYNVQEMKADELFSLIEYETSVNSMKLNMVVLRSNFQQQTPNSGSKKRGQS
jgi:C-terminal processing protease CtpA/Prc